VPNAVKESTAFVTLTPAVKEASVDGRAVAVRANETLLAITAG